MIRQICWKEKPEEGPAVEIRVDFFAKAIHWQFKAHGAEAWDYTRRPTWAQWNRLRDEVTRRYQRSRARLEDLQRVEQAIARLPLGPP